MLSHPFYLSDHHSCPPLFLPLLHINTFPLSLFYSSISLSPSSYIPVQFVLYVCPIVLLPVSSIGSRSFPHVLAMAQWIFPEHCRNWLLLVCNVSFVLLLTKVSKFLPRGILFVILVPGFMGYLCRLDHCIPFSLSLYFISKDRFTESSCLYFCSPNAFCHIFQGIHLTTRHEYMYS